MDSAQTTSYIHRSKYLSRIKKYSKPHQEFISWRNITFLVAHLDNLLMLYDNK